MKLCVILFALMGLASCSGYSINDLIAPGAIANIINNGDSETIEEPCKDSSDLIKCVQEYLKSISRCIVPEDINDSPAMLKQDHFTYVPVGDMIYIMSDANMTVKGNIEGFYVNRNTNNLVMTVEFENVHVTSKNVKVIISRKGKEPKIVSTDVEGTYHIVTTAVIPIENTITLDALKNSYISTYIPSYDHSTLHYGPEISNSEDPVVAASYKAFSNNLNPAFKEYFLTAGPNIYIAYLQKYICNFGFRLPY